MRSAWFEHVSKTRKKLRRERKEDVTHRQAMAAASVTWPKEKEKIQRRLKREKKRQARENDAKPVAKKAQKPEKSEI